MNQKGFCMNASFSSLCETEFNAVEIKGIGYSLSFKINALVEENDEARDFVISGEPKSDSAPRFALHLNANELVQKMRAGDRAPDTFLARDYLELANPFAASELEQAARLCELFREEFVNELLVCVFVGYLLLEMARCAGDRVSYEWVAFYAFTAYFDQLPFPKTLWVPWDDSIYE